MQPKRADCEEKKIVVLPKAHGKNDPDHSPKLDQDSDVYPLRKVRIDMDDDFNAPMPELATGGRQGSA